MTVNRMYHPPSDIDSLYMPSMEGGQRLLGMTECVETEEQYLSLYLVQLEEKLLRFSKSERILRNRNRKRKKDTSNGKRNSSMVNLCEKQKKSELRRQGNGLGKII